MGRLLVASLGFCVRSLRTVASSARMAAVWMLAVATCGIACEDELRVFERAGGVAVVAGNAGNFDEGGEGS